MMRPWQYLLASSLLSPALALAGPAEDAISLGNATTGVLSSSLSTQPAQIMTPGYTASPPAAFLPQGNLNASTTTLLTLCQASPSDPSCEAILKAQSDSAVVNAQPSMINDSAVQTSLAQIKDPANLPVLGAVTAGYSNCTTNSTTTGGPVFASDSCYNYYLRVVDQPCTKNLVVNVSWSCNAGATGPYTDGAGNHYCDRSHIEYSCNAGETQVGVTCQYSSARAADQATVTVQEASFQVGTTWSCNAGATGPFYNQLSNFHYCTRLQVQYSCQAGESLVNYALGPMCFKTLSRAADQTTVTVQEAAVSSVSEYWDSGCSGFESRVPPGLLPPDGQDPAPGSQLNSTGSVDKCERTTSVCSDAIPITRVIDTVPVTNSCWQYANTFSCVNPNTQPSDCSQAGFAQCTHVGSPVCIDWDQQDPTICTATQQNLSCPMGNTTQTVNTVNCAGQTYTDPSGQQWGTSHTPDTSFGTSVAYLEAAREGGVYMGGTQANLELFKGFGESCVKKLFGLVNCCAKSGGINIASFSNASLAMSAAGAAGKALGSSYTYDALFSSEAPQYVLDGFAAIFTEGGSGYGGFAGFLAGDVSTVDLLAEMVPGPWTIAILVIEYSGILSCPQNNQITSIKRGGGLCVDTGEYCSKKLKWIGTCLERTQTTCCFNSKLAKDINVQGKAQLGQGFNCSGFTPQDFSHLDLSKMDFSDFLQDVHAQAVDVSATASRANPANCYYGPNGKCN